jgi:hypothetical protein
MDAASQGTHDHADVHALFVRRSLNTCLLLTALATTSACNLFDGCEVGETRCNGRDVEV